MKKLNATIIAIVLASTLKRVQALPIDMFNFLTSYLMSGRPTAAEQYRQTRLGSPM